MNKAIFSIVLWVFTFGALACIYIPLKIWWDNPALTQMQMFKTYWGYWLGALVCGGIAQFLTLRK